MSIQDTSPTRQLNSRAVEVISGLTAGVCTTLVVHPLDLIKTRMQLDTSPGRLGHVGAVVHTLKKIQLDAHRRGPEGPRHAQFIRELYRGLGLNIVGNASAWGIYFTIYDELKSFMGSSKAEAKMLSPLNYWICAFGSGVCTAFLTNPFWVLKTRILSSSKLEPNAYRNVFDGVKQVIAKEGVLGFWQGLVPSLMAVSHGAIQFSAYDSLKKILRERRPGKSPELSTFDLLFISACSKATATLVTYPLQVCKSRLQAYNSRTLYGAQRGFLSMVKHIFQYEGVLGFYKGLLPNLVRVIPSTCITFTVYEHTKRLLSHDT